MTKEFVVALDARPGTLAETLSGLAKENVNVRGGFGVNVGDFDAFHFVADDEARAERALRAAHARYRVFDVVTTRVADKPGELLKSAEKLARAGVNIEAIFTLGAESPGAFAVAFRVRDPAAAERALRGP